MYIFLRYRFFGFAHVTSFLLFLVLIKAFAFFLKKYFPQPYNIVDNF